MASQNVVFHTAAPARFCAFHPVLFVAMAQAERPVTVSYEVRNLNGDSLHYLSNAVPSVSYLHLGNGRTRVTAALRYGATLEQYLADFHEYAYTRLP